MDRRRFDALARALSMAGSRREAVTTLLGGLLGLGSLLPAVDAASARKQRKHKNKNKNKRKKRRQDDAVTVQGPCGDGSGPDNRCEKDGDCCTRNCDKKKRRCRCLKEGQACSNDRLCCPGRTGRTCLDGSCQPAAACLGEGETCIDERACCAGLACQDGACLTVPVPTCTGTCAGCCDAEGFCQDGTAPAACGVSGDVCGACADDQVCWQGACVCGDVCANGCEFTSVQDAIDDASNGATIRLCAERYVETINIEKNVTLIGAGAEEDDTILDGGAGRVIRIGTQGAVSLEGLRITGGAADAGGGIFSFGTAEIRACIVTGNEASVIGGGIVNAGTMTLTDTSVADNESSGEGGGIAHSIRGPLTLVNSTVIDNRATTAGGGIYNEGNNELILIGSSISDNVSNDFGGGIFNQNNGRVTLTDSTIFGNESGTGAGIYNRGPVTLTDSSITNNEASVIGGGITNVAPLGTATLNRSSITGNRPDNCNGTPVDGCTN